MIKGLRRTVAESGKIKIGGLGEERQSRSGGTYRLPVKHDYFTITKSQREGGKPDGDLLVDTALMTALTVAGYADDDGRIRKLPVMLYSDDIDEVFPTAYVAYSGKTCACRGDGETATRFEIVDGRRTGDTKEIACPCDLLKPDGQGVRRCKYSGILHASIRLPGFAVVGSVHRWRTTSQISCEQMVGHLEMILATVGALRGLPLALVVRPVQVNPVGGKPTTVYVCHVDLAEQLALAQQQALDAAQLRAELGGNAVRALPLMRPGNETDVEAEAIAAEYYADAEVVGTTPAGVDVIASPPSNADAAKLQTPTATPPRAEPSPAPAEPPPAEPVPFAEPEKPAGRRSKCKPDKGGCGQMFGPGIINGGLCGDCRERAREAEHVAKKPGTAELYRQETAAAPEPAPAPPSKPSTATTTGDGRAEVGELCKAAFAAGAQPAKVLAALRQKWPDADDRTWSMLEIVEVTVILDGLSA